MAAGGGARAAARSAPRPPPPQSHPARPARTSLGDTWPRTHAYRRRAGSASSVASQPARDQPSSQQPAFVSPAARRGAAQWTRAWSSGVGNSVWGLARELGVGGWLRARGSWLDSTDHWLRRASDRGLEWHDRLHVMRRERWPAICMLRMLAQARTHTRKNTHTHPTALTLTLTPATSTRLPNHCPRDLAPLLRRYASDQAGGV
jgi:hypothetical protein